MDEEASQRGEGAGANGSWLKMSEGLIGGVHHALNNRMAALRAVGQVVETDLDPGHPLAGAMTAELDRLEQTVALLRMLGIPEQGRFPIPIDGILADAARLFEIHHALRELELETECAEGLLPVYIEPDSLLRGLVLMYGLGGKQCGKLRTTVSGDERTVVIRTEGSGQPPEWQARDELDGVTEAGLHTALERAGGRVTAVETDPFVVELELLTLPEARRREAEG